MAKPGQILEGLLGAAKLEELAGADVYARGRGYFNEGRVYDLGEVGGKILARVQGSDAYRVAHFARDGALAFSCNCPMGKDGTLCKHSVAVGLAWTERRGGGKHTRDNPYEAIRAWLHAQDKGALAELLLNQTFRDKRLLNQLHLRAVRRLAVKGLAGLRRLLDQASRLRSFIDYEDCAAFTDGIMDVLEEVAVAVKQDAPGIIELCEHALQRVKLALENMDDSDGEMSAVIERIQEIHLQACQAAKPDPEALARKLP